MSLLGIDVGTTGCKAVIFSLGGEELARSTREYEIISSEEGYAELDASEVWQKVLATIREAAVAVSEDPVSALSVSSLGEAMVPVSKEGRVLDCSILGSDRRGEEFVSLLEKRMDSFEIFRQTGCLPGNFFSMPKIAWIRKFQPRLYEKTGFFLTWADFICFMLGGKPAATHSLAGRTLLFDIHKGAWSDMILQIAELDKDKFAPPFPAGTFLGFVREELAGHLHLGKNVSIFSGGHDQCCAALGSGVKSNSRSVMYGMGTFACMVPVFAGMPDVTTLYNHKLNIEHHVIPGSFISLVYNQSGGALVKWIRQVLFSGTEPGSPFHEMTYDRMFSEIPGSMNDIIVLPRFGITGPPDFLPGNLGVFSCLSLNHTRGDILRAALEGISFYFRDCFRRLAGPLSEVDSLLATGGGSVSGIWLQITADILGKKVVKNRFREASSLGAAMIAGVGSGQFNSVNEAIDAMVRHEETFSPNPQNKEFYDGKFQEYQRFSSCL